MLCFPSPRRSLRSRLANSPRPQEPSHALNGSPSPDNSPVLQPALDGGLRFGARLRAGLERLVGRVGGVQEDAGDAVV